MMVERHRNPKNEGLRHVTWKFSQVLAQNPLFLTRKQPGASYLGSNDEGCVISANLHKHRAWENS